MVSTVRMVSRSGTVDGRDDGGREALARFEPARVARLDRVGEGKAGGPGLDAERVRAGEVRREGTAVRLPEDDPAEDRRVPAQAEGQGEPRVRDRDRAVGQLAEVDVVVAAGL